MSRAKAKLSRTTTIFHEKPPWRADTACRYKMQTTKRYSKWKKAAENLLSHPIRVSAIQAEVSRRIGVSPFLEGDPKRDEARDASRDALSLAKEQPKVMEGAASP